MNAAISCGNRIIPSTTTRAIQSSTFPIKRPRIEHCFARCCCQNPTPKSATDRPKSHGRSVVKKALAAPAPRAAANPSGRQQLIVSLASSSFSLPGFDHSSMNHFRRRKTDLLRSRIQATTQRKTLHRPRLPGDISSIDSNGRRAKELELAGHSFIADKDFLDFRHYTFCDQDIFDRPHSRGMRRTFRNIQDFDFHFALSGFCGFLFVRIGQ